MKNSFLVVFLVIFLAGFSSGLAQEPEENSTMTLTWWDRGWNNFSLHVEKLFGELFLLKFERGGPAEKLLLGIPLHKNRGNNRFPCYIMATGPTEVFEGQKINIFLIWRQNYGRGIGRMEAVPVQLAPIFLPAGYDSLPYDFGAEFPVGICQEDLGGGKSPFFPQALFTETVVVKKLPPRLN